MSTLGESLVKERKKKNISLEEISKKTNIGMNCLTALEADELKLMPGDFYLKNYIKSYLNAIGCDEKVFWEENKELINAVMKETPGKNSAYYSKLNYSRFKKVNFIFTASLCLILILLTSVLLYLSKNNLSRAKKQEPKAVAAVELCPIMYTADDLSAFSLNYSPIQANIDFNGTCWIQVRRGNLKIIEQVYKSGDKLSVKGYELIFLIGKPSAVKFVLNNKEVTYLKDLTQMEKLTVNPTNWEDIVKNGTNGI